MGKYSKAEKGILAAIADLSAVHGPVELRISGEPEDVDVDTGYFPGITLTTAPDGVIRGLMVDDRIAAMQLESGVIRIIPIPRGLQDRMECLEELGEYSTKDLVEELWKRSGEK